MASDENVAFVMSVCPSTPKEVITKDLQLTENVEHTINRILDGRVTEGGLSAEDSDEDLPESGILSFSTRLCEFTGTDNSITRSSHSEISHSKKPIVSLAVAISSDEEDNNNKLSYLDNDSSHASGSVLTGHTEIGEAKTGIGLLSLPPFTNKIRKSDYFSSGSDEDDLPPTTSILGVSESSTELLKFKEQIGSGTSLERNDAISISSVTGKRMAVSDAQQGKKKAKTQKSDPEKQLKKEALEREKQEKKRQKEEEKARKAAEREAKKQEKLQEAARRKALQQARKNAKPGECLKHVTVMLDTTLMQQACSKAVLEELQKHELRYEVQPQAVPNLVTWWREVTQLKDTPAGGVTTDASEKMEDQLLVLLPHDEFVQLVYNFVQQKMGPLANNKTLRSYVIETKLRLENRPLTLVVQGMDNYWRNQKIQKVKNTSKKNMKLPEVSKLQMEEALLDVQIQEGCNVRLLENDVDVGKLVFSYTKAVAETPFKQERLKTGFSFFMESGASVRIEKDGRGVRQAWRQMLQQFKNVTADIANAIIAEYPSPCHLNQAYETCPSSMEAELLLQDILVRRGVGVTETTRRVGKELSRRLWEMFTQRDPDHVIR